MRKRTQYFIDKEFREKQKKYCREYKRKQYATDKEFRRKQKKRVKEYLNERYSNDAEFRKRILEISKGVKYRLKLKVLQHYSHSKRPFCKCCGERHIEFLTIDHINGWKHSPDRNIPRNKTYRWLRNHKYPKGYQVLCFNCNIAKGFYGVCPHKR